MKKKKGVLANACWRLSRRRSWADEKKREKEGQWVLLQEIDLKSELREPKKGAKSLMYHPEKLMLLVQMTWDFGETRVLTRDGPQDEISVERGPLEGGRCYKQAVTAQLANTFCQVMGKRGTKDD